MVAVFFTTILCERNRAISTHRKLILVKFIPVITKLCMQGLKFSDLFYAFL